MPTHLLCKDKTPTEEKSFYDKDLRTSLFVTA